ncbi:MAG: DUF6504 family protein [bacterium]
MPSHFVSEPLKPVIATADTSRMAAGEPGLPREFVWRGRTIVVRDVVRSWKDTGPCSHGSGEKYVRKHWYEVRTETGQRMKIYFERQARSRARATQRWWLFTTED